MSLGEYKRKRNFQRTAEPPPSEPKTKAAKTKTASAVHNFVIQKHDATRLHYDFRLEMDGVLASWAVPKGLPFEKGEKHLAVHVEDHPVEYADFEGIIPKGEYGGGSVMLWDRGQYELLGGVPVEAVKEGKLHLLLHGEKVDGEWTLVRTRAKAGDKDQWLILKTGDSIKPVSKKQDDCSILTGRTMKQIAEQQTATWHSSRPESSKSASPATPAGPEKKKPAPRPTAAQIVEPMKAQIAAAPPAKGEWLYELKWDGYRALAYKQGDDIALISRTGKALAFPEISEALENLRCENAILDGEICALNENGVPSFGLLQARETGRERPPIFYYVFDLLVKDGVSFVRQPLQERRRALRELITGASDLVRFSASLDGEPQEIVNQVRALGVEGLIGKRAGSLYEPGLRSGAWIKLKFLTEQEFVIGGFTPPTGTRPHLGAVLVGYWEKGELRYAGKVGTGFDRKTLKSLHTTLLEHRRPTTAFVDVARKKQDRWGGGFTPATLKKVTWVDPKLVCQVRFSDWTDDDILRQPVFIGLRPDKDPAEVIRERAEQ